MYNNYKAFKTYAPRISVDGVEFMHSSGTWCAELGLKCAKDQVGVGVFSNVCSALGASADSNQRRN
jgi:hypothetical protein